MSALGMGDPTAGGPGAPGGFPSSIQIGGGPAAGPGAPDDSDDADTGDTPEQELSDALDALHKFMQTEDDHAEKAIVAKCVAALQGLLGTRQKGAESALGVTPAHKAMARAY